MLLYAFARICTEPSYEWTPNFRGTLFIATICALVLCACWTYRFPGDSLSQAIEFGKESWEFLTSLLENRAILPQNLAENPQERRIAWPRAYISESDSPYSTPEDSSPGTSGSDVTPSEVEHLINEAEIEVQLLQEKKDK